MRPRPRLRLDDSEHEQSSPILQCTHSPTHISAFPLGTISQFEYQVIQIGAETETDKPGAHRFVPPYSLSGKHGQSPSPRALSLTCKRAHSLGTGLRDSLRLSGLPNCLACIVPLSIHCSPNLKPAQSDRLGI